MKGFYIALFLGRVIIFAMLVVVYLYLQISYLIWGILSLFLLYTIAVLIYRPYSNVLANISLVCYELTMAYSIGLALAHNYVNISNDI